MDENKKPGQRDISDLKARLGLKKTAAMPAASPAGATPPHGQQPIPAPIPAPTQPASARPIPSPFGQPAPEPAPQAAPSPPDPRRDPFAQQQAANLAAFYGIGQALPGDASAVDGGGVAKKSGYGNVAILAIACLVFLGVGNACGRIMNARVEFNNTIDQSGQIRDEVERLAKQLNTVADKLNASTATKQGQPDFDMSKSLADADLKKPDQQKLFHTNYYHLEDITIDRLFNYYNNTIRMYDLITVHAKKTENDRQAIENGAKASGSAKSEKNYGVTVQNQGGLMIGSFVEVGTPVCQQEGKTDCNANELKGFKFRDSPGGGWGERPVKGAATSVIIPIQKSPLFNEVAAGNPDILAYRDYLNRVVEIKRLAGELTAQQKEVLADMKRNAEKAKVFTF